MMCLIGQVIEFGSLTRKSNQVVTFVAIQESHSSNISSN
jgi:hypothetical protein